MYRIIQNLILILLRHRHPLDAVSHRADKHTWINPRSLPLIEISAKLFLLGAAVCAPVCFAARRRKLGGLLWGAVAAVGSTERRSGRATR